MAAPKVTITYCAECGYEDQALALARSLMVGFTSRLASVELVPWDGGTFDVAVDGRLVHSMARDGGFPDAAVLAAAVHAVLAGRQV